MNNKGFIVSALLYSILILFIVLVVGILVMLSGRKITVNKIKDEVINEILEIQFPNGFNNTNYQDSSGASVPKLSSGMIPIRWDGSKWVKADITQKWYDYDQKEWANVVLVTNESRLTYQNAYPGEPIDESDVLAYLVWIPRYRYQLFNVEGNDLNDQPIEIEIVFESKTTPKSMGTENGQWLTHPAFTFGGKELNGIWVGKFETSTDVNSSCYTTPNPTNCDNTNQNPRIKPNVVALRHQSISNHFATAQKISNTSDYGITSSSDSHIMKNIERGAVTYLSKSQYGNDEIEFNVSAFITGGGNYISNVAQSTTGNVYGIYDLHGGSWDHVMANYNNLIASSGFSSLPDAKYYDLYTTETTFILGDGTIEMNGLDNGGALYLSPSSPWYVRGGAYGDGEGLMSSASSYGSGGGWTSFFIVITEA